MHETYEQTTNCLFSWSFHDKAEKQTISNRSMIKEGSRYRNMEPGKAQHTGTVNLCQGSWPVWDDPVRSSGPCKLTFRVQSIEVSGEEWMRKDKPKTFNKT